MGNETNSYFDPIRWEFELPSGVPTFGATFAIPLSSENFECIGKLATLLGIVEEYADTIIGALSGVDDPTKREMFYGGMQFGAKIDLVGSLAKVVFANGRKDGSGTRVTQKRLDRILEFCSQLKALNAKRNHAIHGRWGFNLTGEAPEPASDSMKRTDRPLYPTELQGMVEEAERLARETWQIWLQLCVDPDSRRLHATPVHYWFYTRRHPYKLLKSSSQRPVDHPTQGHRREATPLPSPAKPR